MGGVTLGIYVVHIAVYTLLRQIFSTLCMNIYGIVYVLYVFILTLAIFFASLIICRAIEHVHILSKFLLGK